MRLIRIKAHIRYFGIVDRVLNRRSPMPIDSILVSAAVVAMFVVFAGVLMWGDHQTRAARPSVAVSPKKHRSF